MGEKRRKETKHDKSQEPYDYKRIEELGNEMLADPEAQKNWEEIQRRLNESK